MILTTLILREADARARLPDVGLLARLDNLVRLRDHPGAARRIARLPVSARLRDLGRRLGKQRIKFVLRKIRGPRGADPGHQTVKGK